MGGGESAAAPAAAASIQRWLRPKQKWKSFTAKFNRPWKELLAEEITKVASEQAASAGVVATPSEFENLHLDEDSDAESLVAHDDAVDAKQIITDQV